MLLRVFTLLVLPLMLLGCGRVLAACSSGAQEGVDLSALGLTPEQVDLLSRRFAIPYYSAAAAAMFLFALAFSLLCAERPVVTLVSCIAAYILLEAGTLVWLYRVVKSE